ncbi:myb domain-containing protein [Tieghemostelium lacteum]|uniref:Myb domain-containing protein n=1 Tax=Tieghemostelium lacteum TaxID=361077 RepID=A0A151ZKD1_TIELA|nr:myb domain-containing protein [Tieghemostelium lacteum]|eukprot:KYQ94451.1 myb domain-containing protein [Tieghemostelium lacteum]
MSDTKDVEMISLDSQIQPDNNNNNNVNIDQPMDVTTTTTTTSMNSDNGKEVTTKQIQPTQPKKETARIIAERIKEALYRNLEGETISLSTPIKNVNKSNKSSSSKKVKKSKWELLDFRNPVRRDQLILKHWVNTSDSVNNPAGSDRKTKEYKYEKFNKKMEILMFTDDEYENYLKDDQWSKEDTTQLIELCKRFDSRFIVVFDRFEATSHFHRQKKTIDDLKERYYRVQSKLIELRSKPEEDNFRNPMASYQFNKTYEMERKHQMEKLHHLSVDKISEQESLQNSYIGIEKHLLAHSRDSKIIMKRSSIALHNGAIKHYDFAKYGSSYSQLEQRNKRKNMGMVVQDDQGPYGRLEGTLYELSTPTSLNHPISKLLHQDLKEDIAILLDLQKCYLEKRYHCEILKAQKDFLEKELEQLGTQIPYEALSIHVDEENETIQNLTDSELPPPSTSLTGSHMLSSTPLSTPSHKSSSISTNTPFQLLSNDSNSGERSNISEMEPISITPTKSHKSSSNSTSTPSSSNNTTSSSSSKKHHDKKDQNETIESPQSKEAKKAQRDKKQQERAAKKLKLAQKSNSESGSAAEFPVPTSSSNTIPLSSPLSSPSSLKKSTSSTTNHHSSSSGKSSKKEKKEKKSK